MNKEKNYIGVSTSFYCHDGKGRWLLHRRSKACRDEQGTWDCGGGKVEVGLPLEENVLKEIREEYCCDALIQAQLPVITLLRKGRDHDLTHWIVVPFIFLINEQNIKKVKIGDGEKMDELGWFRFDSLPVPLHSGFQKTISQNSSLFKKYSSIL